MTPEVFPRGRSGAGDILYNAVVTGFSGKKP
jgi:hypothetical protein